jgi:hypothetical protein
LAVREESREALIQGGFSFHDRLLHTRRGLQGAAGFAGLALPQRKLPFTRRLGPKALRFSDRGIQTWIRRDVVL